MTSALTLKKKVERCNRVPRLSDTRYSGKGTRGRWRYAISILYCIAIASYLRSHIYTHGYLGGKQI